MSLRVLVADMSPVWRERYHKFFSMRGCQVETATGGLECLDKVQVFEPDLLVLDLEIPWGGGDGVLDRLRELNRSRHIAVVLTGGAAASATLEQLAIPPVVRSLMKPFDDTVLRETVGLALLARC